MFKSGEIKSGTLESARGGQPINLNLSDSESVDATSSVMNSFRIKNEVPLSHKTKVRQIKPPSRIVYEWEWDIPKFDKAFPLVTSGGNFSGGTKVLTSEKIVAGADIKKKSDWYFLLSEVEGRLSWHLILGKIHKFNSQSIHTAFSFKIVDCNGKELLQKKRCFRDFQVHFKFGWDEVIDLEKLYERKDVFLTDNVLRTQIMLEMFTDRNQCQIEAIKQERDDFAKLMTTDMWRLRTATGTADIHLECEGKVFPVHKLILSARSAAFSKMFDTPIVTSKLSHIHGYPAGGDNPPEKEQTISTLSIPDVEAPILEIVLEYIYSGNVKPLTNQHVLTGVIRAADKFELLDLKSFCFNALMNFVTEENIGNLAVVAYRHNAEKVVRMNINGYCLRNLTNLMRKKTFRDALKTEPDAFFPDDDLI